MANIYLATPGVMGAGNSGSVENVLNSTIPSAYLTPDALLAYCATRLKSLDTQTSLLMGAQQETVNDQTTVNAIGTILSGISSGASDANNNNAVSNAVNDIQTDINGMPDSDAKTQLQNMVNKMQSDGTNGLVAIQASGQPYLTVNSTQVATYQSMLSSVSSTLNSNSQLGMIQIQSLMSQRETAIQLTTNLMSSYDDASKDVAANVGH
jgi:hypothetical protein